MLELKFHFILLYVRSSSKWGRARSQTCLPVKNERKRGQNGFGRTYSDAQFPCIFLTTLVTDKCSEKYKHVQKLHVRGPMNSPTRILEPKIY